MKRLSKLQETTLAEHVKAINEARDKVQDEFSKVVDAIAKLNGEIDAYNATVTAAGEFRDEIVGEMESYADERSDKWRDSEAGSAYEEWKSEWENYDAEEIDQFDSPDDPQLDHAESLEQLPLEVPS